VILGVDLAGRPPVAVAVRDGALLGRWPFPGAPDGVGVPPRAACVAVELDDVALAPVAVIRVGGPCPEVLRPLVGWPEGSGVAVIVRGGHSLTGRPLAPLDTAAVRRFAATCGLVDFAVTATGSPVLAEHELAVAGIVAEQVPGARITLSYEFGRHGLRERENDAIRSAALGPQAGRIADEVAGGLPGVPVYFARSGSGLVSAHYFRRYPLACYGGASASLARGLAAGVAREVAAAYGATVGGPEAQVERIVQARGRAELDRALRDVEDEVLARVVSAGAAPGSARVAQTAVNPLSYLPDGLYRVRVAAEGATP
jgi:hypothetical protein